MTNPLEQLIELTEKICLGQCDESMDIYKTGDDIYELMPLISFCLGREIDQVLHGNYTDRELIEDYSDVLKLLDNAKEFVIENSNERSLSVNLSETLELISLYRNLDSESTSEEIKIYNSTEMETLKIISLNLSDNSDIKVVDKDEIQSIINQLDGICCDIEKSSLRSDIKIKMIDNILAMRLSIIRINITGCDDAIETYERLIGQMIKLGCEAPEEAEENRDLLGKMSEAIVLFRQTVDSVSTAAPVLQSAGEVVMRVLGGG